MRGEKEVLVNSYPVYWETVGRRWSWGYAATQLQAVFDLRRELACCMFAIGVQHRFPSILPCMATMPWCWS
jgi:hypothetical protein